MTLFKDFDEYVNKYIKEKETEKLMYAKEILKDIKNIVDGDGEAYEIENKITDYVNKKIFEVTINLNRLQKKEGE